MKGRIERDAHTSHSPLSSNMAVLRNVPQQCLKHNTNKRCILSTATRGAIEQTNVNCCLCQVNYYHGKHLKRIMLKVSLLAQIFNGNSVVLSTDVCYWLLLKEVEHRTHLTVIIVLFSVIYIYIYFN